MMRMGFGMMRGGCAMLVMVVASPAVAQSYPNYPSYITARGTYVAPVTTHYAVPIAPAIESYPAAQALPPRAAAPVAATAPTRLPVPQAPHAALPPYQPSTAVITRTAPVPVAARYAAMAPASGPTSPPIRNAVNADGNRFTYGDVRRIVPGAKEKMEAAAHPMELETHLAIGYRTGELKWDIAGMPDGTSPNVLSELTWDKLQMMQIDGGARYVVPNGSFKNMRLEGNLYYAYATSGDNQDSDYEFDNRQNEFSRSNNNAEGSAALGVKIAAGYEIPFIDQPRGWQLKGTPLVGWQAHKQRLRMQDGNQTVCGNAPSLNYTCGLALGPFDGLNSHYTATWSGPFLAMEGELGYGNEHRLRLRGEYGYMNYSAEARWNMRPDFAQDPSFKQDADGQAVSLSAEYRYALDQTLGILFSGEVQKFKADGGKDKTYLAAGGVGETRFNNVTWDSQAYRVGVEKQF